MTRPIPRLKTDPFAYINRTYGLNIKKHSPVICADGRRGQVVKADGQYIYIQWDGEDRPQGPFHPTDRLSYPAVGAAA